MALGIFPSSALAAGPESVNLSADHTPAGSGEVGDTVTFTISIENLESTDIGIKFVETGVLFTFVDLIVDSVKVDGVPTIYTYNNNTLTIARIDLSSDATVVSSGSFVRNLSVNGIAGVSGIWISAYYSIPIVFPASTYNVEYNFRSTDGSILPQAVLGLRPTDTVYYADNTEVTAAALTSTTVTTVDGMWMFIGWDAISKTIDGADIAFTGRWAMLQANVDLMVLYMANGGTGGYDDTDIPYESEYTALELSETNISRDEYTFKGWNTKADGSGDAYAAGYTFTITDNLVPMGPVAESFRP